VNQFLSVAGIWGPREGVRKDGTQSGGEKGKTAKITKRGKG